MGRRAQPSSNQARTLRGIIADAGFTVEEFVALLK